VPVDPQVASSKIALVVPCYRPAPGWVPRLIARFQAFAKTLPGVEVRPTVVHDGTPGGLPPKEIADLHAALPNLQFIDCAHNSGKGAALRKGLAQAGPATAYLYTDIDLPYTNESMIRVAQDVLEHGGVAAGERFEDYYDTVPPFRRWLSRAHRQLMRRAFRLPVSDSQAGLKGFDATGREIFLETTVDRFLVDLDFIARCRGRVAVRPIRVELRPDVVFTDFGLTILRTEASNFWKILRRSWG